MEKLYYRFYGKDFSQMVGCPEVGTGKVLFKTRTSGGGWHYDLVAADYGDSLPSGVELVTPENVEKMIRVFFWDSAVIDGVLYLAEANMGYIIGQKGWKANLLRRLGIKAIKQGYALSNDSVIVSGKTGKGRNRLIATPDTRIFIQDKSLDKYKIWAPNTPSATLWRRRDFVYSVCDGSRISVTYGDAVLSYSAWDRRMVVSRKVSIPGQEIYVEFESWPEISAENVQNLPDEYRPWAEENIIRQISQPK